MGALNSVSEIQRYLNAAVPAMRRVAASSPAETKKRLMIEAARIEFWTTCDEIAIVDDPFRGELTIYRNGRFVLGLNGPSIDAALAALTEAIGEALQSEEMESPSAVDAVGQSDETPHLTTRY